MALGGSPRAYCNLATLDTSMIPKLSSEDLSHAQQEDPCLGEIWRALKGGDLSKIRKEAHKDLLVPGAARSGSLLLQLCLCVLFHCFSFLCLYYFFRVYYWASAQLWVGKF